MTAVTFSKNDPPFPLGVRINEATLSFFELFIGEELEYGEYFFFNSSRISILNTKPISGDSGNIYWVVAKILEEIKPKELK